MAKAVPAAIIDLMLDQAEGTNIHICTTEPANYAAIAGVTLATAVIAGGYTAGAGSPDGRQNSLAAQTGISITTSGNAQHVVVSDGASVMKMVTTCTLQALVSGGTVDTNAIVHTINAPT